MKILIILLTMLTLVFSAQIDEFASEVKYLRDYKSAIETAKKQNKLVMLVLVGDYCPWCKKFERKTLKSAEVMAKAKENFVSLVIDKYKDKEKYPQEFFSPLIPAVFFINAKTEKSVLETVAYMKPEEFMESMDDALCLFGEEK